MSDVYLTQCNRCANIYGPYYRIIIYTHIYIYIHIFVFFQRYIHHLSPSQYCFKLIPKSCWWATGVPQSALCFFPTGLTGGCHIETDHRGTYVWHLPMAHHEGMILRLRPAPRVRLARANILIMHTILVLTHMYVSVYKYVYACVSLYIPWSTLLFWLDLNNPYFGACYNDHVVGKILVAPTSCPGKIGNVDTYSFEALPPNRQIELFHHSAQSSWNIIN